MDMHFGTLRIRNAQVSNRRTLLYASHQLLERISPELKSRMRDQSSLARIEPDLIKELSELTGWSLESFQKTMWL